MDKRMLRAIEYVYPQKVFAHQLITMDVLTQLKKQLLEELIALIKAQTGIIPKKWMKSHEVRRLLKISPGTLKTIKSSGLLPYTKIGGVHYYDQDDIQKLLEGGKLKIGNN